MRCIVFLGDFFGCAADLHFRINFTRSAHFGGQNRSPSDQFGWLVQLTAFTLGISDVLASNPHDTELWFFPIAAQTERGSGTGIA